MTDRLDLEARLAERLRAHAAFASRPFDAAAVAQQAVAAGGRRRRIGRLEWPPRRPAVGWLIVALLLAMAAIGAVVGIGAFVRDPGPGPLGWEPRRFAQDWPAPVRPEPLSGGEVVPMELGEDARWDPSEGRWGPFQYRDVVGDVGRDDVPWIDIEKVRLSSGGAAAVGVLVAGQIPLPIPNPEMTWIAYGLVLDTNGDAVADVRIGIDNMPSGEHRAWHSDLASGETRWSAGPPYGLVGEMEGGPPYVYPPGYVGQVEGGRIGLDTWYPGDVDAGAARFRFSVPGGERPLRFYAWASVIERGRVIATDYAPDFGWLEEGTQPELTLVGPVWAIESDFTRGGDSFTLVQTLSFTADGKVAIDAGCHAGIGNMTAELGTLRLSDLVLTEVGCSSDVAELDAVFIAPLLAYEFAYTIDDRALELRAGSEVLRFTATYDGPPKER